MKKINIILRSVSLLILFQSTVVAANIYVDHLLADDCQGTYSIANRDSSGSDGDAYNTPQEVADAAAPGDTVYFREGTYYNHTDLRDAAVVMNILTSGTVNNPITYTNYNNENVILSGMRPNSTGHYYVLTLGIAASDRQVTSGQGVQNIIIDGIIVEGASRTALRICGPADQTASAQNPTENIIIRNVIVRNNSGGSGAGGGIITRGKMINVLIEYCEAYNNTGTGIGFGRISKSWHLPEPEDDMSAAQYCVIRNCLSYDNIHPTNPGNTDGMGGSHMYRCTIENNVIFNNSDDGLDIYASIETTVRSNIIFGHSYAGGNNAGLKFSAGGGGRHTIAGNIVFNNDGYTFECSNPSNRLREYYPSRIYGNLAYNGSIGFSLGTSYNQTFPGYEKVYLRNNIALDNRNHDLRIFSGIADSDYNFISDTGDLQTSRNLGHDANSLTGVPGLVNKNAVIDTNFGSDWSVQQKLNHIRSQIMAAFSPKADSQLIDKGIIISEYHNPYADDDQANPMDPQAPGRHWQGTAPEIGAFEYGLDPFGTDPDQTDPDDPTDPNDPADPDDPDNPNNPDDPVDPNNSDDPVIDPKAVPDNTSLTIYNNILKTSGSNQAVISVELKEAGKLTLTIYDAKGTEIITLCDSNKTAGTHSFSWNGMDSGGNNVGSGIYVVHMKSGSYSESKKIAVVK